MRKIKRDTTKIGEYVLQIKDKHIYLIHRVNKSNYEQHCFSDLRQCFGIDSLEFDESDFKHLLDGNGWIFYRLTKKELDEWKGKMLLSCL